MLILLSVSEFYIYSDQGTEEELRTYVGLGFYIAITGFVCNEARGLELRNIIKHIPTDKLVLGLLLWNLYRTFPNTYMILVAGK